MEGVGKNDPAVGFPDVCLILPIVCRVSELDIFLVKVGAGQYGIRKMIESKRESMGVLILLIVADEREAGAASNEIRIQLVLDQRQE